MQFDQKTPSLPPPGNSVVSLCSGAPFLLSINPRAVYCSVSGYGQDGPYSQMAGHDINYISFAGALGLIGPQDGKPSIPLNLIADYAGGGLCGAVGILAALMAREKTGAGQYVDIAMSEGVLYMLSGLVSDVLSRDIPAERGSNRLNGGAPYYNVYQTKDGKYFSIAAIEPWFWENLCRALDLEGLLPHQDATGAKKAEVEQALSDAFLAKNRDEWFETLKDANISVGKVYSIEEALDDPHAQKRGMVLEIESPDIPEGKVRQVATSIHLSDTPGEVRSLGSVTGQHTSSVLEELGFDAAAVADLMRRQVVQ